MDTLNQYVQRLEKVKNENKTSIGLIAKYLLNNLDQKTKIESANQIARDIAVSNAMISRFCLVMGFKNIYEVLFLQKLTKTQEQEQKYHNSDLMIKKAAAFIENARKVFFIGVSNGFLINQDFARKINRLDKWTYVSDNKYEQVGNARLLIEKDLLIVNSVSLQHTWMRKIIKNTLAKVILISDTIPKELKNKITIFFPLLSDHSDNIHRNVTYEERTSALKILDLIFQELINKRHNQLLLKATRYNKN